MTLREEKKLRVTRLVKALRSGDYYQITETLAGPSLVSLNDDLDEDEDEYIPPTRTGPYGYCCLGVACEVAIGDGLNIEVDKPADEPAQYDGEDGELPSSVRAYFGFGTSNPVLAQKKVLVRNGNRPSYLTDNVYLEDPIWNGTYRDVFASELNDEYGWSFNQIADAFERVFILDLPPYEINDKGEIVNEG